MGTSEQTMLKFTYMSALNIDLVWGLHIWAPIILIITLADWHSTCIYRFLLLGAVSFQKKKEKQFNAIEYMELIINYCSHMQPTNRTNMKFRKRLADFHFKENTKIQALYIADRVSSVSQRCTISHPVKLPSMRNLTFCLYIVI